jgi:hypothetical protein
VVLLAILALFAIVGALEVVNTPWVQNLITSR